MVFWVFFYFLGEKHKVLLELIAVEQFGGFDPGLEMEMLALRSPLQQ